MTVSLPVGSTTPGEQVTSSVSFSNAISVGAFGFRRANDGSRSTKLSGATPLALATFTFSADFPIARGSSITIMGASLAIPTGSSVYAALLDESTGNTWTYNPGQIVCSQTLPGITCTTSQSIALPANNIVAIAFYSQATQPTPTPTITQISIAAAGSLVLGQAALIPINVIAYNQFGAAISTQYPSPISVTLTGAPAGVTLTSGTIANPASTVAVTYDGRSIPLTPFTITAATGGVSQQATIQPSNDDPVIGGSSYSYAETDVTTVNAYNVVGYSPPPTVSTTQSSGHVIVVANAAFAGQSGYGVTYYSDDAGLSNQYGNLIGKIYENVVPSGNRYAVVSLGDITNDRGNLVQTVNSPASILDLIPSIPHSTWSGATTSTTTYTTTMSNPTPGASPDVTVYSKITNVDGSYSETQKYVDSSGASAISTDVLSSTLARSTVSAYIGYVPYNAAWSAPVAGIVTYTESGGQAISATPKPSIYTSFTANYFTLFGNTPQPPETDVSLDQGTTALPAACAVPPSVATTARLVTEQSNTFVPGKYAEAATIRTYSVPGIGFVCATGVDNINTYDYMQDLIESTTDTFLEVVTANSLYSSSTRRTASASSVTALAPMRFSLRRRLHARLRERDEKLSSHSVGSAVSALFRK